MDTFITEWSSDVEKFSKRACLAVNDRDTAIKHHMEAIQVKHDDGKITLMELAEEWESMRLIMESNLDVSC